MCLWLRHVHYTERLEKMRKFCPFCGGSRKIKFLHKCNHHFHVKKGEFHLQNLATALLKKFKLAMNSGNQPHKANLKRAIEASNLDEEREKAKLKAFHKLA